MIKAAISKDVSDKSLCEKLIAEKLDIYILLFEKEMSEIPFNTLYKIFTHKDRNIMNQERAYQLIKKIFNDSNDDQTKKTICILFETLDANKISKESFQESISQRDEHFGFCPKYDFSFFDQFNQKVDNQIESLLTKFSEMQQDTMNQIKSYFDQKINNELTQINDIKSGIQILSDKVNDLQNNSNQMQANVSAIHNEVQQMAVKINDIQNTIQNISIKNDELNGSFNNISEKVADIQNKANSNSRMNEEIKSKVEGLPENVIEIKTRIQQMPGKVDEIKDMTSKLFKVCSFNYKDCKCGIIDYLCEVSGGNLYENGTIGIETTKVNDGNLKNLFDKSRDTHFRLANQKGGYIILDFKDRRINFYKYYFSVPSQKTGCNAGRPKSWSIEGSNDKETWNLIDKKENDTSLNDYSRSNTFTCQKANMELHRYIKITEIEEQHSNQNFFMLSELEFYGTVKEK